MSPVPARVASRIASGLKRFQPILEAARARDANESDTVIIVMDLLGDIFGYDKYSEITSEHAIRGTFCDLAIKIDGALALLIEVKAIGLDLRDQHVKQATDYASNQGCEWALNRFTIGALLLSEPMVDVLRRELRRTSPDAKIDEAQIRDVLATEVLRREILEGEKAEAAKKRTSRAAGRSLRSSSKEKAPRGERGTKLKAPRQTSHSMRVRRWCPTRW